MTIRTLLPFACALLLGACQSTSPPVVRPLGAGMQLAHAANACSALVAPIASSAIGLPSGAAMIDSAVFTAATPLSTLERGPTPAATIIPANPDFCKVLGSIAPIDPAAPLIKFQVNLPANWNGRSVQYGGGGFNGVLISALGLIPAARFDQAAPLAQGYVTYGTDSGHQNQQGQPPQTFALNDEALINFSHASYKKVRDVAVVLMSRAYGSAPDKLYFVGSSEGGREGLTMAQRYPKDFDGIFSRVPVINWTGLQLAGTRNGAATMGDAWLRPAQVKLVHDAVLAACDEADGLKDGLVSDAVGCKARFDVSKLLCTGGVSGDSCLSDLQVRAVQTLHSPYKLPFALANGVTEYPGWGVSGEATPASGPTGGWSAWWLGSSSPTLPPQPTNAIAWFYGSGALQYFYARDPKFDVRNFNPEQFSARMKEVSALMDSTNPDLSAFHARGGKLIMLENMADYAQSPYAGIRYYESVVAKLGAATVQQFVRLYTAPGVDHVGAGAPANVDMLSALTQWVEKGQAPSGLQLVSQNLKPPFTVTLARPMCEWPMWPRYKGGDGNLAESFECVRTP
jgi:Tannase and feruloyl esterase